MRLTNLSYKEKLNWKAMIQKLVLENCLTFGHHSRLTSKKVTKYLTGTRVTTEIFKLYELRYLLLKIYPLIHNLFYIPRLNSSLQKRSSSNFLFQKNLPIVVSQKTVFRNQYSPNSLRKLKKKKAILKRVQFNLKSKQKMLQPQILFATTTPVFASIVKHAAQICNMPWHQNRWSNGFMTGGMPSSPKKNIWNFLEDSTQKQINQYAKPKWKINKENYEKTKEKNRYYSQSRWPSLVIIPDLSKNLMIVQEAKKINLPVMGMVNSHCSFEIDYPIFAQDQTFESVHFFCCFLATLIAKENIYFQHKRYVLQKALSKSSKIMKNFNFKEKDKLFSERFHKFSNGMNKVNGNQFQSKALFFRGVKPIKQKRLVQQKLLNQPSFFSLSVKKKKLSRIHDFILKQTPPRKLFFTFLRLYLKIATQYPVNNRKSPAFLKELINWAMCQGNDKQKKSPIEMEKRNRYLKNRLTYFWNVQEKQILWKTLQTYVRMNKIAHKQWKTSSLQSKQRFWIHSYYYWLSLQQWHNEPKWSGHRFILENIITNKQHAYELMERQKVGPKWKSKLKSHINSKSYKYVPRNDYLFDQEKSITQTWTERFLNSHPFIEGKRFDRHPEFKAYLLKKYFFKQKFYKKYKKKPYPSRRQAWHKH